MKAQLLFVATIAIEVVGVATFLAFQKKYWLKVIEGVNFYFESRMSLKLKSLKQSQ